MRWPRAANRLLAGRRNRAFRQMRGSGRRRPDRHLQFRPLPDGRVRLARRPPGLWWRECDRRFVHGAAAGRDRADRAGSPVQINQPTVMAGLRREARHAKEEGEVGALAGGERDRYPVSSVMLTRCRVNLNAKLSTDFAKVKTYEPADPAAASRAISDSVTTRRRRYAPQRAVWFRCMRVACARDRFAIKELHLVCKRGIGSKALNSVKKGPRRTVILDGVKVAELGMENVSWFRWLAVYKNLLIV